MTASISVPVVAGLAAGIVLIIVFSMNFQSVSFQQPLPLLWPEEEKFMVIIPLGAYLDNVTFIPEKTRAALNHNEKCCGVIKWVNNDTVPALLRADDDSDLSFYLATQNLIIKPGESFEHTFTKPGEYGFHSRPWQHGTVEILPCLCSLRGTPSR